jgi:hypothetical protein
MPNAHVYLIEERKNGDFAVKGEGKKKAAVVKSTEPSADRSAHHLAGRTGVVECKDVHGRFTHGPCPRCKKNR